MTLDTSPQGWLPVFPGERPENPMPPTLPGPDREKEVQKREVGASGSQHVRLDSYLGPGLPIQCSSLQPAFPPPTSHLGWGRGSRPFLGPFWVGSVDEFWKPASHPLPHSWVLTICRSHREAGPVVTCGGHALGVRDVAGLELCVGGRRGPALGPHAPPCGGWG